MSTPDARSVALLSKGILSLHHNDYCSDNIYGMVSGIPEIDATNPHTDEDELDTGFNHKLHTEWIRKLQAKYGFTKVWCTQPEFEMDCPAARGYIKDWGWGSIPVTVEEYLAGIPNDRGEKVENYFKWQKRFLKENGFKNEDRIPLGWGWDPDSV